MAYNNQEQAQHAFDHKSNNTQATQKPGITPAPKLDFLPNPLDIYDAVTYHFKLFITDLATSSSGSVLDISKQIIIAESGVTEMTIDKVEIRTIATPTTETGTGTSTQVKFEVFEPGGAGMIDKLFYQSINLGIGNWVTMPFYLQLNFRSRNPDTSEADDASDGQLSSQAWVWALKVTKIKTTVSGAGAKYEFETIIANDYALTNAVAVLTQTVKLEGIDTFGNAMVQLEEYLNTTEVLKNYAVPDVYKVYVDPVLVMEPITPPNKTKNPHRNDDFVEFNNKDATFLTGASIDKVIDTLLAQTDKYQKSLPNTEIPGGAKDTSGQGSDQMKKFWRIVCETKPLAYDAVRNDLAREISYYVVEYSLGAVDTNITGTAQESPSELDRIRFNEYVSKSVLKKKYNYIFTGLNDQVITFDLTINCAFAQAVSRLNGIYSNIASSDKGTIQHKTAEEEFKIYQEMNYYAKLQHNSNTRNTDSSRDARARAAKQIDTAEISEAKKEEYRRQLAQQRPESKLNTGLSSADQNRQISYNFAVKNAKYLSEPSTDRMTDKQYRFISDVDLSSKAVAGYLKALKDSKSNLRPVAQRETIQDKQTGQGVEANSNAGIQQLSSMFSTALHGGLDASFQRIKMTIKGDPFWLAPPPTSSSSFNLYLSASAPAAAIDKIKNNHKSQTDAANLLGTDNFILVRFRTPKIYAGTDADSNYDPEKADDGETPDTDLQTFSGVYKVIDLVSKFEKGKFTQELNCNLDDKINILNIQDLIEGNAAKKDTPVPVTTPAPAYSETVNSYQTSPRVAGPATVPATVSTAGSAAFNNDMYNSLMGDALAYTSSTPAGYSPQQLKTAINDVAKTSNIPSVVDTVRGNQQQNLYTTFVSNRAQLGLERK